MLYSLRSIALLMLVAGVALGIFASTLMANKTSEVAAPTLDRKVEEHVNSYEEFYDLDALTADVGGDEQAQQAGIRHLMTKPLQIKELGEMLVNLTAGTAIT